MSEPITIEPGAITFREEELDERDHLGPVVHLWCCHYLSGAALLRDCVTTLCKRQLPLSAVVRDMVPTCAECIEATEARAFVCSTRPGTVQDPT